MAYEMRISDWSSDVSSSDLLIARGGRIGLGDGRLAQVQQAAVAGRVAPLHGQHFARLHAADEDLAPRARHAAVQPFGVEHIGAQGDLQIGRASCRARVCKYVENPEGVVYLKKKKKHK